MGKNRNHTGQLEIWRKYKNYWPYLRRMDVVDIFIPMNEIYLPYSSSLKCLKLGFGQIHWKDK
jgi:hypothetical protein